ncbi:MAG: hypothetical protein IKW97_07395 [Muribaculaceae bacterium]|nr:hypothetical protein [Muribaculaceae bacterium]MBR5674210.1 hypothetical protein [Muribaculaceae bacterium]
MNKKKLWFVILIVLGIIGGYLWMNDTLYSSGKDVSQHLTITADMAYQGVNNYCHSAYDWSVAEENPSMMSLTMGEETETEYQVIFRSYTGAIVNFYVDKTTGTTRMVEYVPTLDVKNEAGTIDLFDYIEK